MEFGLDSAANIGVLIPPTGTDDIVTVIKATGFKPA